MSAPRSVGSITVAFGLISIPVKLYSATNEAAAIKFNLLDKDGGRLKQQYVNASGAVIERANMVKGYEFAKDQYVIFTPEELKAVEEAGSKMADIVEFVPSDSVDPLYFDKPYFLAPDPVGAKTYALLATALRDSGRVAIGRWAARGKTKVVMIRPVAGGLVMQQLLYANEVRSMNDITIPTSEVKDSELKLAMQLIEAQAADAFDPAAYKDDVSDRIAEAVQKKIDGAEFKIVDAPATAQVIDIASALKASIEKKRPQKAESAPATDAVKKPKSKKTA